MNVPEADPIQLLELIDSYAGRFGLDPEVGMRQLAEHYGHALGELRGT